MPELLASNTHPLNNVSIRFYKWFIYFQWTIYRMQMVVDADPAVNDQRLADIRHIADTTSTDGTCFAYGEPFVFTETTEV